MATQSRSLLSWRRRLGLYGLRGRWKFIRRYGLQFRKIWNFGEIPGWLTTNEALALYRIARALPPLRPIVLEIGSFLGQSSMIIGKGLEGKDNPILYCIDPFNAAGDASSVETYSQIKATATQSLRERFELNLWENHVERYIQTFQGYSYEYVSTFSAPLDCLFIDGDHEYSQVRRDYHDWAPKLKPAGILVMHDVFLEPRAHDFSGPGQVAQECVMGNAMWSEVRLTERLLVATRTHSPAASSGR